MKKLCLLLILMTFFGFLAFGETGEQEEVDFLLFLPNSGNQFVNEEQAMIQLDNLAEYLGDRNLSPGQIFVYGYAADVANDIEPVNLSRDRALFVINELQKRGVLKELFSDPVAYGPVDIWGSNADEANRSPNRRVRIMLDGNFLTPAPQAAAVSEIIISSNDNVKAEEKSNNKFPWIILLLLLLIALLIAMIALLSKHRKKLNDKTTALADNKPESVVVPIAAPVAPAAAAPVVACVIADEKIVNLEEEIRYCAYMLSLQRSEQYGDPYGDWCVAVCEISARYQENGYTVYMESGTWWARR